MKYKFVRKVLTSSIFAAAALSLNIARAQSLPPGVQDVVKMKQAGLSDDVILAQIRNAGQSYNLTADQIISLKQAGVSEPVIKALMATGGAPAPAPVAPTPAPTPTAPPPGPAPAPAPNAVVVPPNAPSPGGPAPAPEVEAAPSFDAFQAQLAPYGSWIQVPGYGLCWQPSVAFSDPGWRPYFDDGHWVYTDDGWAWQSDYPWGDIAFHYGRWFRVGGIWTWVPGYHYAPAWVTWREADGYSGWAPLPPAAVFHPGVGLYYDGSLAVDVDFGLGPADFVFVPYDHFWDYRLRPFFVPRDRVDFFFHHSHVMNGYRMDHGHFMIEGPGHEHVFAVTHHPFRVEHDSHWDMHGGRFDGHYGHDYRFDPHAGHDGHFDGHDGHFDGGRDGRHDH